MLEKIQAMLAEALNLPLEKVVADAKIVEDLTPDVILVWGQGEPVGTPLQKLAAVKENIHLYVSYQLMGLVPFSKWKYKKNGAKKEAIIIFLQHPAYIGWAAPLSWYWGVIYPALKRRFKKSDFKKDLSVKVFKSPKGEEKKIIKDF